MDLFKYKASIKQLELCKYVKDLEELIRGYVKLVPAYANDLRPTDIYYYKLLVFSLKLFQSKSNRKLPDFIYDRHRNLQEYILRSFFEAEIDSSQKLYSASGHFTKEPTYEEFMDWFEFDTHIDLPFSSVYVEKFNSIIGDNPVHFTVKFNYRLTDFDEYSTVLGFNHKILAYSIRHKQVNFPTKPQTIWDIFIADNVQKAKQCNFEPELNQSCITKLKQQIRALESLEEYLA